MSPSTTTSPTRTESTAKPIGTSVVVCHLKQMAEKKKKKQSQTMSEKESTKSCLTCCTERFATSSQHKQVFYVAHFLSNVTQEFNGKIKQGHCAFLFVFHLPLCHFYPSNKFAHSLEQENDSFSSLPQFEYNQVKAFARLGLYAVKEGNEITKKTTEKERKTVR
jgi:hypothetical protein